MGLGMNNPSCPLCWENDKLKGGRVLGEGEEFFVYVFENEDGSLKYALICTKRHHQNMTTLSPSWGQEFGRHYALILKLLGGLPHNGYWNEGETAGQRILGHWHVRIEPRFEGQLSSGKGPGLLIAEFDQR